MLRKNQTTSLVNLEVMVHGEEFELIVGQTLSDLSFRSGLGIREPFSSGKWLIQGSPVAVSQASYGNQPLSGV